MLQTGHKLEKWQWCHNFMTWRHGQFFFWGCFVSLMKLSYWSKFHVNIIIGSGGMTIFFYKRFTRNSEIGNNHVWVLPNNWRLGQVGDTKFGKNVSNKILLNATKCQGYSFYRFWVIKPTRGSKINPPPLHPDSRLGLKNYLMSSM